MIIYSRAGVYSRRLFVLYRLLRGSVFSFTVFIANFSIRRLQGSNITVDITLNNVCVAAMERGVAAALVAFANQSDGKRFKINKNESSTKVPKRLKYRCISPARFALLDVPTDEIRVVTQVPIFCPIIMGIAAPSVIAPPALNACKMPTDADEL